MSTDRYKNGKIYKLVNDCDDKVYVGSTCLPLSKRLYWHKQDAKKYPDRNVYKHLNSVGWENVKIILIESYSCDNNMELLKRERYYVDIFKPELNKVVLFRTYKEYYEDNKDKIKERNKEYYEKNNDKIKEYKREYCEINKEKIKQKKKEYCEVNKDKIKDRNKEYYEKNNDKIKEHYENNKDKIKEYKSRIWHCDVCNCNVTLGSKTNHVRSLKHQNNMNKN